MCRCICMCVLVTLVGACGYAFVWHCVLLSVPTVSCMHMNNLKGNQKPSEVRKGLKKIERKPETLVVMRV